LKNQATRKKRKKDMSDIQGEVDGFYCKPAEKRAVQLQLQRPWDEEPDSGPSRFGHLSSFVSSVTITDWHVNEARGSRPTPLFNPLSPLRKGKWTAEEEAFTAAIINDFAFGCVRLITAPPIF
jgi:hypothetical protein